MGKKERKSRAKQRGELAIESRPSAWPIRIEGQQDHISIGVSWWCLLNLIDNLYQSERYFMVSRSVSAAVGSRGAARVQIHRPVLSRR